MAGYNFLSTANNTRKSPMSKHEILFHHTNVNRKHAEGTENWSCERGFILAIKEGWGDCKRVEGIAKEWNGLKKSGIQKEWIAKLSTHPVESKTDKKQGSFLAILIMTTQVITLKSTVH